MRAPPLSTGWLFSLAFVGGCGGNVALPADFTEAGVDAVADSGRSDVCSADCFDDTSVPDIGVVDTGHLDTGTPDTAGLDGAIHAPVGCPATEPGDDASCAVSGLSCDYPASDCPPGTMENAECDGSSWIITHVECDPPPSDTPCPESQPNAGDACSDDSGTECGYGDDPNPECRPTFECESGQWQEANGTCASTPITTCPATSSDADGKKCDAVGAFCTYGTTTCGCSQCGAGPCSADARWACDGPNTEPNCPATLPNLGTACTVEGTDCDYGSCAAGDIAGRVCQGGVWVGEDEGCPAD